MTKSIHKYRFDGSIPAHELEGTLMMALTAVESLHGHSRALEECRFDLDKANLTCTIDTSTDFGSDLNRIFTGFAIMEYGERRVQIERIKPSSTTL